MSDWIATAKVMRVPTLANAIVDTVREAFFRGLRNAAMISRELQLVARVTPATGQALLKSDRGHDLAGDAGTRLLPGEKNRACRGWD